MTHKNIPDQNMLGYITGLLKDACQLLDKDKRKAAFQLIDEAFDSLQTYLDSLENPTQLP